MGIVMIVHFMDGEYHRLPLSPVRSWRVCRERNVLIVGRGLDRVEMPLCNIRYWTFE